jgi:hypothetical protein
MLTGLKWSENKKGPKQEAAHERFMVLGFGKRTTYLTAGDAGKLLAVHVQVSGVIDEYNLQPAQCLMSKRKRLIRRSGAKASERTGLVEMTSWLTKPQSKGTIQTMTRRYGYLDSAREVFFYHELPSSSLALLPFSCIS